MFSSLLTVSIVDYELHWIFFNLPFSPLSHFCPGFSRFARFLPESAFSSGPQWCDYPESIVFGEWRSEFEDAMEILFLKSHQISFQNFQRHLLWKRNVPWTNVIFAFSATHEFTLHYTNALNRWSPSWCVSCFWFFFNLLKHSFLALPIA